MSETTMVEPSTRRSVLAICFCGLDSRSSQREDGMVRRGIDSSPLGKAPILRFHWRCSSITNSASASEILAACLQDHRRAVVVGQRSYGKGTVQRLMRIESGRSLLKLTSATYWRPSGRNIHRMVGATKEESWGVKPNQGLGIVLDVQEYLQWRHYRSRRDVLGGET